MPNHGIQTEVPSNIFNACISSTAFPYEIIYRGICLLCRESEGVSGGGTDMISETFCRLCRKGQSVKCPLAFMSAPSMPVGPVNAHPSAGFCPPGLQRFLSFPVSRYVSSYRML